MALLQKGQTANDIQLDSAPVLDAQVVILPTSAAQGAVFLLGGGNGDVVYVVLHLFSQFLLRSRCSSFWSRTTIGDGEVH